MLQRTGAIFLFICLFITVAGYHFVYHIYRQQLKAEMKQYLLQVAHKDIVQLTIAMNDPQLKWEEEKECSLNGKMYDVLEKKVTGDSLILRCVADDKETALINEYQKINQQQYPSSSQKWASLYKLIDCYFQPASNAYIKCCLPEVKIIFAHYPVHISSPSYPIFKPPPQIAQYIKMWYQSVA